MSSFHCQIFYDNPSGLYYAGQTLRGRVEYSTAEEITLTSLYLKLIGEAQTCWSERDETYDSDSFPKPKCYNAYEKYLNGFAFILGALNGPKVILKPGKYVYKFERNLPLTLPSVFNGVHGHVKYRITVSLVRPWRFNQVTKTAFTVIRQVDLNLNPKNRLPVSVESKGPLQVKVSLPQTGYVPGENVEITCNIQNDSRNDVRYIEFILVEYATYKCPSKNKAIMNEVNLVSLKVGGVPKYSKALMVKSIQLPLTPPSLMTGCNIIDIEYGVKIIFHRTFWINPLELNLPIKMGTVPLTQKMIEYQNLKKGFAVPMTPAPLIMAQPEDTSNEKRI